MFHDQQVGNYFVTVTDNNGCIKIESVNVSVIPLSIALNTISLPFESSNLNGQKSNFAKFSIDICFKFKIHSDIRVFPIT